MEPATEQIDVLTFEDSGHTLPAFLLLKVGDDRSFVEMTDDTPWRCDDPEVWRSLSDAMLRAADWLDHRTRQERRP